MIRFACPRCYKKMAADDARAGQIGTCPDCYKRFRVPAAKPAAARTSGPGPSPEFDPEPAGGKGAGPPARPVKRSGPEPQPADELEIADGLELVDEEPEPPPPPSPPRGAVTREPAPPPQKPRVADDEDIPEVEAVEEVEPAEEDERRPASRKPPKKERRRGGSSGARAALLIGIAVVVPFGVCGGAAYYVVYKAGKAVQSVASLPPPPGPGPQPQPQIEPRPPVEPPPPVRPPPPPPAPDPRDPQAVDAECARLLGRRKKEAREWMGEPGALRHRDTMELARYAEQAIRNGAKKVYAVDLEPDEDGDVFPRLVVVLPDDPAARGQVFGWFRPLRPDAKDAGQKYLLVVPKD